MHDQAEVLRKKLSASTSQSRVCAIVSGKGGVGKSTTTVNLAICLSETGKKVLVIDLDIGMANLDILMGLNAKHNIVDLVENSFRIFDIIESGPCGIDYLAGGNGLNKLFVLSPNQFDHFCSQLEVIQEKYDYILLDMGAGATKDSLQFITSADEVLLVTTPEPTAITDAYAMLKHIHHQAPDEPVSIVINRVDSEMEGKEIGRRIQQAAKKFLHKEVELIGMIPDDHLVYKAVKQQSPYVLAYPKSPAAHAIIRLSKSFANGELTEDQPSGFVQRFTRLFSRKQGWK